MQGNQALIIPSQFGLCRGAETRILCLTDGVVTRIANDGAVAAATVVAISVGAD